MHSFQKTWFQSPLLDYEQPSTYYAPPTNVNMSAEITTSVKPFRRVIGTDSQSVVITVEFSEQPTGSNTVGDDRHIFDNAYDSNYNDISLHDVDTNEL
jgi:hypothetical protein